MAVSLIGVGTWAEAANAAITPGLPTRASGDLLGVPEGWVLNDPARGFEPPAPKAQGEGGME